MADIGKTLCEMRRRAGLTQKEVARRLSAQLKPITHQAVSKWETGDAQPNVAQFLALCRLYGVQDVLGAFLPGPGAALNEEGRRRLAEYAELLRLSGLYGPEAESPGDNKREVVDAMTVDVERFWTQLKNMGDMDTLALATSLNDEVTVRPISALPYGGELLIRTDEDSVKAIQMRLNPKVAACLGREFYLKGVARFIGRCTDESIPEVVRAKAHYAARWPEAFGSDDTYLSGKEVFIAIRPTHLSQWVFEGEEPRGFVEQDLGG